MKRGFTLIELLAVIVILAIIALIATPIILNTINDSKKSAAELSVKNYIRAVEIAISNEQMKSQINTEYLTCEIEDNGRQINCGTGYPIIIEYNGQGLIKGTLTLEYGEVIKIKKGKIDNWGIDWKQGENFELKEYKEEIKVTLVTGKNFNAMIKTLANGTDMAYGKNDSAVTSIEFYSNGELPSEQEIKDALKDQKENKVYVDVSLNGDSSILAYYIDSTVYIVSDNLISFNEDSSSMFLSFQSATNIDFPVIDTSSVKNMNSMFHNCKSLTNLELGEEFDTSKVKDMSHMFDSSVSLTSLDLSNFNTSNVEDMNNMFRGCTGLTQLNIKNFKTNKVKNMELMFFNCKLLTSLDVSSFDTGEVENMKMMFCNCSGLTELNISNFNTGNVTNMNGLFYGCSGLTTLNVSNLNTSNVENMSEMFRGCSKLESLNLSKFNTQKVTNMYNMFFGCSNLTTLNISNFNTSSVTDMSYMFSSCKKLTSISIGCAWQTSTNNTNMFASCGYTIEQFNTLVEQTQATCPTN